MGSETLIMMWMQIPLQDGGIPPSEFRRSSISTGKYGTWVIDEPAISKTGLPSATCVSARRKLALLCDPSNQAPLYLFLNVRYLLR